MASAKKARRECTPVEMGDQDTHAGMGCGGGEGGGVHSGGSQSIGGYFDRVASIYNRRESYDLQNRITAEWLVPEECQDRAIAGRCPYVQYSR